MAVFCTSCGEKLKEGIRFCTSCGAPYEEEWAEPPVDVRRCSEAQMRSVRPQPPRGYAHEPPAPQAQGRQAAGRWNAVDRMLAPSSPYAPISTGGFIGMFLLLCIPIAGLVLAIIWAFGRSQKINKRNFARAYLILAVISFVISLVIGLAAKDFISSVMEAAGTDAVISGSVIDFGGSDGKPSADSDDEDGITGQGLEWESASDGQVSEVEISGDGLGELIEDVDEINARAEAVNDGWPASLRPYPGGTAIAVTSYRTEIRDTDEEEMKAYIDAIKADGYAFKGFYDFGMSEGDMLSMNSWWGTDGNIYVSMSFYEDVLTIDHTTELPDLNEYFN